MLDTSTLSNVALIAITCLGMYVAGFWLALIIWTYRDHRSRSRDGLVSIAAALMVTVLNLPGLIIYLLLRPKETLAEAYERSLEEEALLQDIEEKPICPGCSRPTNQNWQVCPYCHTTLKKACINCGKMLELAWGQCPFCAVVQPSYVAQSDAGSSATYKTGSSKHVTPSAPPEAYTPPAEQTPLEFIEGDPYQG